MARVLVTYGWCRTAYVAVRSLSRAGHEVYSCSHLQPSMAGWSRFSKASAAVEDPFVEPVAFVRSVAALVERWGIDVVMPVHEDALALREYEEILPQGVRLACPPLACLRVGVDKLAVSRIALGCGVSIPVIHHPTSLDEAIAAGSSMGFPLVVKLRRANSAKGIAIVNSEKQLVAVLRGRFASECRKGPEHYPYLQAYQPGAVVGGCFLARSGATDAFFGERYLRTKSGEIGTSVFREPDQNPILANAVCKLARALEWDGIGHFDFIEDPETRELFLLEMNPRPWGAINLAFVNGYDFFGATVAHAIGGTDMKKYFPQDAPTELRSMWLIGEGIRWSHLVASRDFKNALRAPLTVLRSFPRTRFDDFVWYDPLPFFAEATCYARGFLRSGGDFNPG